MIHCGQPTAFVVRDTEGLEWFVCAAHASSADMMKRADRITPIGEWFGARALAMPATPRPCNEARMVEARAPS